MSLTSYRAAPPRGGDGIDPSLRLSCVFLFRFGGDLLSHVFRRSTIGATALNFRVRDGIGCLARAMTTKPEKEHCWRTHHWERVAPWILVVPTGGRRASGQPSPGSVCFRFPGRGVFDFPAVSGSDQAYRAISTGQLNALLRLHLRPIDVVVFHGPDGETLF